MKRDNLIIIAIVMLIIFGLSILLVNKTTLILTSMNNERQVQSNKVKTRRTYLTNVGLPIYIDNDTDFAIQAAVNGWKGDGTQEKPFIIEDLVITTNLDDTNAITIGNSSVFFVIRNCTVTSTGFLGSGIVLCNVTNGVLENNTGENNHDDGFVLSDSSINNNLSNNLARNNGYSGFFLHDSTNIVLMHNIARYNFIGFHLWNSSTSILTNNTAEDNSDNGFYMWSSSNHNILSDNFAEKNDNYGFALTSSKGNIFTNNTAQNSRLNGFYLWYSSSNTFNNNTVQYNGGYGFELGGSQTIVVKFNIIQNNADYGVYLTDSHTNTIGFNDFSNNNEGGVQAYSDNSDNTFNYNYWSDYTTPDDNTDGFVDVFYEISGSGNCKDTHPVTQPYNLLAHSQTPDSSQTPAFEIVIELLAFIVTWLYLRKHQYSNQG